MKRIPSFRKAHAGIADASAKAKHARYSPLNQSDATQRADATCATEVAAKQPKHAYDTPPTLTETSHVFSNRPCALLQRATDRDPH